MKNSIYPRDQHVIGSIIAGVVAAGTAIASGASKKRQQRRAQAYQRELLDYQNNIALSNWDKENAYNTPSAQMERYRQAGLNPNLIYSQQNTAGSIGEYQPTSVEPMIGTGEIIGSALNSAYQTYFDSYLKEQNIESNAVDIIGKQIANRTAGYNADLAENNFKIATATLSDTIDSKIAELQALKVLYQNQATYEGGRMNEGSYLRMSGENDARKQYWNASSEATLSANRSDAVTQLSEDGDENKPSTLHTMMVNEYKALAQDYALALLFGQENAYSENQIKKASAVVAEIDAEWQKNVANLDWDKMGKGQILKTIIQFVAGLKSLK